MNGGNVLRLLEIAGIEGFANEGQFGDDSLRSNWLLKGRWVLSPVQEFSLDYY